MKWNALLGSLWKHWGMSGYRWKYTVVTIEVPSFIDDHVRNLCILLRYYFISCHPLLLVPCMANTETSCFAEWLLSWSEVKQVFQKFVTSHRKSLLSSFFKASNRGIFSCVFPNIWKYEMPPSSKNAVRFLIGVKTISSSFRVYSQF